MKKRFLVSVIAVAAMTMFTVSAVAQIKVSSFKLKPTMLFNSKDLYMSFTLTDGQKKAKYVRVEWCAVNRVGDVCQGLTTGLLLRKASSTGPFSAGKKYKRLANASFIGVEKVKAMPVSINIEYMDGTDFEIDITKDNYKEFFPQLEWMDFTIPGEWKEEEE